VRVSTARQLNSRGQSFPVHFTKHSSRVHGAWSLARNRKFVCNFLKFREKEGSRRKRILYIKETGKLLAQQKLLFSFWPTSAKLFFYQAHPLPPPPLPPQPSQLGLFVVHAHEWPSHGYSKRLISRGKFDREHNRRVDGLRTYWHLGNS
jgi:hypothetical protein